MISSSLYRHMKSPYGYGRLDDAMVEGIAGNRDRVGPFFHIYLNLENEIVTAVRYETFRCPWSMASGSVLAKLVENRILRDIAKLTIDDLQSAMGEIPIEKIACLERAIEALHSGVKRALLTIEHT